MALLYLTLRTNHAEGTHYLCFSQTLPLIGILLLVGNFERSKVLATTALASLVAVGHISGGAYFRRSMAVLMAYGLVEYEQAPEQRDDQSLDTAAKTEYCRAVQGMCVCAVREIIASGLTI